MTQQQTSVILSGVSEGSKITELNIGLNDLSGVYTGLLKIEVYFDPVVKMT